VKDSKKAKFQLGVAEPKLGSAILEATGVPCVCNEFIGELLRGIRAHFTRFIDNLKDEGERHAWGWLWRSWVK
jgi:nucleolar protein 56